MKNNDVEELDIILYYNITTLSLHLKSNKVIKNFKNSIKTNERSTCLNIGVLR